MYIKNHTFKDEDTLLEMLFDFGLGTATPVINQLRAEVEAELKENEAFNNYRATLTDEEEIEALDAEERDIRLAEKLMDMFDAFEVKDSKLYGSKDKVNTLLYEVDLV